jgi:hypothetical protein
MKRTRNRSDGHSGSRQGVTEAQRAFEKLGWLFRREAADTDYGIDAYVEVVRPDAGPTGKLLALQVKCGPSYFREEDRVGYVYRGTLDHLDYWTNHVLPVVIVLVDLAKGTVYWQAINNRTAKATGKGWKVTVPRTNQVNEKALEELVDLSDRPVLSLSNHSLKRFQRLQAERGWMLWLAEEEHRSLKLDVRQLTSKLGGRGSITIAAVDEEGEEEELASWGLWLGSSWSFADSLRKLLPWAQLEIDEDEYFWSESDHPTPADSIYPCEDSGEEATWKLIATLNELGHSFLQVDGYLENGWQPESTDEYSDPDSE